MYESDYFDQDGSHMHMLNEQCVHQMTSIQIKHTLTPRQICDCGGGKGVFSKSVLMSSWIEMDSDSFAGRKSRSNVTSCCTSIMIMIKVVECSMYCNVVTSSWLKGFLSRFDGIARIPRQFYLTRRIQRLRNDVE